MCGGAARRARSPARRALARAPHALIGPAAQGRAQRRARAHPQGTAVRGAREVSAAVELLYVDEHIAVMNKPSGLLVHRGWDDDDDVALFRVRDALASWVTPVHRLDRGTSGAVLFARSAEVAATLSRSFEAGRVEKSYLALVRGTPPEEG